MYPKPEHKRHRLKHNITSVNFEDEDIADAADLSGVEQFHATSTLVLIELETDAVVQLQHTAVLRHNNEINGVRLHQHVRHGAYMYGL